MAIRAVQLDIYRTSIAMRSFEHAAATRNQAEAVVVRAVFSDGLAGWGETLPRPYVTGETLDSVAADLEGIIWPALAAADFSGVEAEVTAAIAAIPTASADGRCINAAACAVELACVDAHMKRRGLVSPAGLFTARALPANAKCSNTKCQIASGEQDTQGDFAGAPVFEAGVTVGQIAPRVTGVLGSADAGKTARRLRLMRWYGLRDFKLKLGLGPAADAANLGVVRARLAGALSAGRCTLRVDVNGGWTADETPARVAELAAMGVCAVEQPVFCPARKLVDLARKCVLPLIADESLVTGRDAAELLEEPGRVWLNVRMSKNGGLLRSGGLILRAAEAGSTVVLGCMVGETAILSSAQRRLLQVFGTPVGAVGGFVRFVEGNYGRLLLAGDVVRRSPRFGYGGRLRVLGGAGMGVEVDLGLLERHGRRVATLGR